MHDMPDLRARMPRASLALCPLFALAFAVQLGYAASIHGVVTDTAGGKIAGVTVDMIGNGKIATSTVSSGDGSFQLTTGADGRFFLVVSAKGYRQLQTPGFYAARLDSIERNMVVEPEWARESMASTATGIPTPQAQTSEATSAIGPLDIALRDDLTGLLRLMPGTSVVQTGQMGAKTSLYIRGGDASSTAVLLDGASAGDLGGRFDFGEVSTAAVESAEVYRGPASALFGADAGSGAIALTTPHGTTDFPSLLLQGDAGNFNASREEAEVAGAHKKFDYLAAFRWMQTGNELPRDEFHVATTAANLGWQPTAGTLIRGTLHYGVASTGVPNAWNFYHATDSATQKDQDLFIGASIDNQTTASFHNLVRYDAARKREQSTQWSQQGSGYFDAHGNSLGDLVTIAGANGFSATGRAVMDAAGSYPIEEQFVSDRDQLAYQGDYRFTPHVTGSIGFHYEDERGATVSPRSGMRSSREPTSCDYLASVHGDYKNRFFYTLSGSLERSSFFGTATTPHAGVSYYALRPRKGIFSGTRVLFNYGDGVREPSPSEELVSLYSFLVGENFAAIARQLHIGPLAAPRTRLYEGGLAQSFFSDRLVFRASYFHNQFSDQIESVGGRLLPSVIPDLSASQKQQLETALGFFYQGDFGLGVNSLAYRAQGAEATVEGGIGRSLFLRGGYTYLDGAVQRSFDSGNEALMEGKAPSLQGIPIGAISPLVGARPFRRPPHTGFLTASYAEGKFTGAFTAAFASRSDDSTYLEDADANDGNSLLLPNRNLDHGFAKLDLGGSYQLLTWLGVEAQGENLMNSLQIAPIGYRSLPFNFHAGFRLALGKGSGR
jgi:vitamin B12 transporter